MLAWRATRANQMVRQYPWLYARSGPLGWREIGQENRTLAVVSCCQRSILAAQIERTNMNKLSLGAFALAFGACCRPGDGAGHRRRGGGSDDRRPGDLRPPDARRRRTGGRRHQCRRRRARHESSGSKIGDDACDPKQARSVAEKLSGMGVAVVGRPLLLLVLDPGLGRLSRRQRAADHAGLDQSAVHRSRHVEHVPHLRPRRPAGRLCRRLSGEEFQGQEHRHHQRQDHLRQRPRRRGEEGAQRRGREREAQRVLQSGRQGLHRARLQAQAQQYRYRL